AEVAVDVLVIVAGRQAPELPLEALAAGVVLAGRAPAVSAPVAERLENGHQLRRSGQHRAALAGRHVVRGIERQRCQVAEGPRQLAVVEAAGRRAVVTCDV